MQGLAEARPGDADHRSRATRPKLVQQAEAWILEDPGRPHSIPVIARHFHVSARHLHRAFQAEVGMSPARYLKRYRMTQARLDLLAADPAETGVAEVAVAWGFWGGACAKRFS